MAELERLWSTLVGSLVLAIPLIVAGGVAVIVQWLRVRRARLRAERMLLPPSTEPPEPPEPWYSLRPRRRRRRPPH